MAKLRLVVVHATKVYPVRSIPFNVGLPIKLPEFSYEQVQELAVRHGLDWAQGELGTQNLACLLAMVGGHPYLVRVALITWHVRVNLNKLLQEATLAGIYSHHLRHHRKSARTSELAAALKQVVTAPASVTRSDYRL